MKIGSDHWIEDVTRELIPGGTLMPVRRLAVIHFTSGASAMSSVSWWRSPAAQGACAHAIIDRDGHIIQCRPFNRTAGHAGVSRWKDPSTGVVYTNLNACSIGIELANAGDDMPLAQRFTSGRPLSAAHRNGGKVTLWEPYPAAQLAACTILTRALVARYNLDDITGHDCIAPERKNDPGPAFPMRELREECGFTGLPDVHWPKGQA